MLDISLLPRHAVLSDGLNAQTFPAIQTLTAEQLEQLWKHLKACHDELCADQYIALDGDAETICAAEKPRWTTIIANFLINDSTFQQIIVDEVVSKGSCDFKTLRVASDHLVGIYLPKFYHAFTSFDDGLGAVQVIIPDAVKIARAEIEEMISTKVTEALKHMHRGELIQQAPPTADETPAHVIALFKLTHQQKILGTSRAQLHESLGALGPMLSDIKGAEGLLQLYATGKHDDHKLPISLIDQLYKKVHTRLKHLEKPSMKSLEDPPQLDKQKMIAMQQEEVEEGKETELADKDVAKLKKGMDEPVAFNVDEIVYDETAEEEIIRNYVSARAGGKPVMYPGLTPPNSTVLYLDQDGARIRPRTDLALESRPPNKAGASKKTGLKSKKGKAAQHEEEMQSDDNGKDTTSSTAGHLSKTSALSRTQSGGRATAESKAFSEARQLSQEEEQRAMSTTVDEVLNDVVDYLLSEDKSIINKAGYDISMVALVNTTKRSEEAEKAKPNFHKLLTFSGLMMQDNWYHIRCFLNTIAAEVPALRDITNDLEKELAQSVCVIHRGASDPVPWVMVVEGILRAGIRKMHKQTRDEAGVDFALVDQLYNEMAVFAHGMILSALAHRLSLVSNAAGASANASSWYKSLRKYEYRCALSSCLEALPPAKDIPVSTIRGYFSIGVADPRVGKRAVRGYISSNRNHAYPCIYSLLSHFAPHKSLVPVVLWFGELFHSTTCKAGRSKATIPALPAY